MLLETEEDGAATVFRDVIFLALAGFIVIVLALLAHLNPPGKQDEAEAPPPGQLTVEARWPDEVNADVDLWVQAPGDMPVGYSNKGGKIFNLLRDDLGRHMDLMEINFETSYTRGLPAGEYTVNLHLYRNPSASYPVPVSVRVSAKPDPKVAAKELLFSKVELRREGEEKTVFRFQIDKKGALVKGSVNSIFRPLRAFRSTP